MKSPQDGARGELSTESWELHYPEFTRNNIAHELGHNFGLSHGGDETCNYKPNYNSVMNYLYANGGVDTNCDGIGEYPIVMGYSDGSRLTLDENNLNELAGLCSSPVVRQDWNNDRKYTTGVVADINPYGAELLECGATFSVLHDFNDWAALDLSSVNYLIGGNQPGLRTRNLSSVQCFPPVPKKKK